MICVMLLHGRMIIPPLHAQIELCLVTNYLKSTWNTTKSIYGGLKRLNIHGITYIFFYL